MSKDKNGRLFIGTSGFYYNHWVGKFYPKELPKSKWLIFYGDHFSSLEVNSSFYHLPKEKTFLSWYKKVPFDFRFSLKASKFITHTKRLKNVEEDVKKFVELALILKEKLGVILFQLPESLKYDYLLLKEFLLKLPEDNVRYAIEFRNLSWFRDDVYKLLRNHMVALCNVSSPKIKEIYEVTTSFLYIRFHGIRKWYNYNYTEKDLIPWVKFAKKQLACGKDVYVYFNNDLGGYAIPNARLFGNLIKGEV